MVYVVYVCIPFGIDDTLYVEYSGIEHNTYKDAKEEQKKADRDANCNIIYSKIECWEK